MGQRENEKPPPTEASGGLNNCPEQTFIQYPSQKNNANKFLPYEGRGTAMSAALPTTYLAARRALAECARIDQCKEFVDKHKALASYAKQAADSELFDLCTRIKARAMQRMGELLQEFDAKGKRTDKPTEGAHGKSQREAAASAGLSEHQQLQAVRVANVPAEEFDRLVEGINPPTVTALAEIGTKHKPKPVLDAPSPAYWDADYTRLLKAFHQAPLATRQWFLKTQTQPKPTTVTIAAGIEAARNHYVAEFEKIAPSRRDGETTLMVETLRAIAKGDGDSAIMAEKI
jgi:hypothetical protein